MSNCLWIGYCAVVHMFIVLHLECSEVFVNVNEKCELAKNGCLLMVTITVTKECEVMKTVSETKTRNE